ncbi:hypothetical protein MRX96_013622 [Rhipicephalus microplus]
MHRRSLCRNRDPVTAASTSCASNLPASTSCCAALQIVAQPAGLSNVPLTHPVTVCAVAVTGGVAPLANGL